MSLKKVIPYAIIAIVFRTSYFIDAPLWLDYFNRNTTGNGSEIFPPNATEPDPERRISASFLLIAQTMFATIFFGTCVGLTMLFRPGVISDFDRSYPKKNFAIIGGCQGISSVLFNFSMSGSRTAPYLQAVLANFNIPIQFIMRFFILHKRPTLLKIICASVVMIAEFISLIPKIFPSLESAKTHHEEGGSSGIAGVLWPMCCVASQIPFATSNSIMERSVKSSDKSDASSASTNRLNIMYFLFWWNFFIMVTAICVWWVDLIPGFGTSAGITDYGENMWFNLQCLFGQAGCGSTVVILGWGNFIINMMAGFGISSLVRVSEGANFTIIVMTIRTPLLFLWWTLFEEQPFKWNPQAHLSTWLSLAAIVIMLPAVVFYDRAPPEKDLSAGGDGTQSGQDDEGDRSRLIDDDHLTFGSYVPSQDTDYSINPDAMDDNEDTNQTTQPVL